MASYDGAMKYLLAVLAFSVSLYAAQVGQVKTVYVMPMLNGMDQYLTSRLTANKVVQVVTDPQKADAVLTDAVGPVFEEKFAEVYRSKEKTDAKAAKNAESGEVFARVGGGKARGTVFLVDPKSHEVIWSVYELPKDTSPDGLNRSANRISDKLNKAVSGKAKE